MPATVGGYKGNIRRRNKIAELHAQGLGSTEIARRLGIVPGTVTYYLTSPAPTKRVGKRPYRRKVAPIVLGSEVNGSGNSPTLNDSSLLDLLWARLTVEEKVKAIKGLEADNG